MSLRLVVDEYMMDVGDFGGMWDVKTARRIFAIRCTSHTIHVCHVGKIENQMSYCTSCS